MMLRMLFINFYKYNRSESYDLGNESWILSIRGKKNTNRIPVFQMVCKSSNIEWEMISGQFSLVDPAFAHDSSFRW